MRVPGRQYVFLGLGLAVITAVGIAVWAGPGGLTGFVTTEFDKDVAISVGAESDGEVSRFGFDQFITIEESTYMDVELANTGSTEITGEYTIRIYDVNNTLLYTYPGPTVRLQPGTFEARTTKHTPHETGMYIVRLEAEIDGDTVRTADFLVVDEKPEPEEPEPTTIVRKEINWIYPPEEDDDPLSRNWEVSADREMNASQNSSAMYPVQITNTGEAVIRNVQLAVQSSDNLSVSYDPSIMFGIEPGETRNFMLTVTPDASTLQQQQFSYSLTSDSLSQNGDVTVNVLPEMTLQQLRDEIARLEFLIADAEREISTAEENGVNVTAARESLADAESAVADAETAVDREDIQAADAAVADARDHVRDTFHGLFTARSENLVVTAPLVSAVHILLFVALLLAALLVAGYIYLAERHEERPKLLREMDEE